MEQQNTNVKKCIFCRRIIEGSYKIPLCPDCRNRFGTFCASLGICCLALVCFLKRYLGDDRQ